MAFDRTKLHRVINAPISVFIYVSDDAIATVAASGYFNGTYDSKTLTGELRHDDVIIAIDSNVPTLDILLVTSADNASTVTTLNSDAT